MIGTVAALLGGLAGDAKSRHKVLVVDDEKDIRDAVKSLLERGLPNVTVATAASGADGIEILRQGGVDLILTDYKMPGMNGLEFLEAARRLAPQAPRILITAFEKELADELGRRATDSLVFTKPLDPRPLVTTCQRMLATGHA